MQDRKIDINYFLICFVIGFVPLHYFICEIILNGSKIDNLLRDIVVLYLFFSVTKLKIKRSDLPILCSCLILFSYAVISYAMFHYSGTLNLLKTYILPMLFYCVCSKYEFTEYKYITIQKMFIKEMTFIGIVGFLQAFFLKDQFLIKLGYPSKNGFLDASSYYIGGFFGYQRNIATFVSPNACGDVLAVALLVQLLGNKEAIKNRKWLVAIAIIIALCSTFSRSAILGVGIAILFVKIIAGQWTLNGKIKKRFFRIVVMVFGLLIVVSALDSILLGGLFGRMLKSSFLGTVTGTDASMIGHINDLIEPIYTIIEHPFGLGFGCNGPLAIANISNANTVESSVYLMMYEVGVIPALIIFSPYVKLVIDTIKNKGYKYYIPAAVTIMTTVTYLLLPNIQTYEVLFYVMMYMGLYYNKNIKNFY